MVFCRYRDYRTITDKFLEELLTRRLHYFRTDIKFYMNKQVLTKYFWQSIKRNVGKEQNERNERQARGKYSQKKLK